MQMAEIASLTRPARPNRLDRRPALPPVAAAFRRLRAGEVLYWAGDRSADGLCLIVDGCVKTLVTTRAGKECLLEIHVQGDVLGEACLLGQERTETAIAMVRTSLVQIRGADFVELLRDRELLDDWLRYLAARLSQQRDVIARMVTLNSEQRLAATLLHLAGKLGRPHAGVVRIGQRLTQVELAGMVGTTRSRVGLFLKRFRHDGLIEVAPGAGLDVHEERLRAYLAGR